MTNLQLLREQAGMSQGELARKLRTTRLEINKMENGWYCRIPDRIQKELGAFFGPDWTEKALLAEVPRPDPGETIERLHTCGG